MFKQIKAFVFILFILLALISNSFVEAETSKQPPNESTSYDLINAVNALRAAYGLPAYSINSILMFTAQNQADFMLSNGIVVHTGPGGSTVTQRLLAAGYPLGGDLSLGGFRSENIIAIHVNMSAEDAVSAWMGDAPHQYTMLSPDLTEIGGGVAVVNGLAYYVIDCARPAANGVSQASTPVIGSGATIPAVEAAVSPVVLSTPNESGEVIHEIQPGQTLWQIAISYGVKIDELKRLNNLFDDNIYPGNKLLVKREVTLTSQPPTAAATLERTATSSPSATSAPTFVATMTQTPVVVLPNTNGVMLYVIAIIVLAILGGGFFTWLGSTTKTSS